MPEHCDYQEVPIENLTEQRLHLNTLAEIHAYLSSHFAEIADTRVDRQLPLYFIEHGLTFDQVECVHDVVRTALRSHSLDSSWWSARALPVVVSATEMGYAYEGNGTEYWPRLSEHLRCEFSYGARLALSNLFAEEARRYSGVTPPDSNWARTFCHIAWPIVHSAVPKDIRLPFAQALAQLSLRVADADDGLLYDAIRTASPDYASLRYESWLLNRHLVVPFARQLLSSDVQCGLALTDQFLQRVAADIRSETVVRRQLRRARRRQRHLDHHTKPENSEEASPLFGTLCLGRSGEKFQLFGELPDLPLQLRKRLRSPLRTQRWSPVPWGLDGTAALSRRAVLQRAPFPLSLRALTRLETQDAFFTDTNALELGDEDRRILDSVRFRIDEPMLFERAETDDDLAYQIDGIPRHEERLFAVMNQEDAPQRIQGITVAGNLAGGVVLDVDLSSEAARAWLGLKASKGTGSVACHWKWIFPSPIESGDGTPHYRIDDPLVISLTNCVGGTIEYQHDGEKVGTWPTNQDGLLAINLDRPGSYRVFLNIDDKRVDEVAFVLVDESWGGEASPCAIELFGPTMTAGDLIRRQLVLEFDTLKHWNDVPVQIRLDGTSAVIDTTMTVPNRVGVHDPLWERLLGELGDAELRTDRDFQLSVSVASLAHRSWRLDGDATEVWWENVRSNRPVPVSDLKSYDVCSRKASEPRELSFDVAESGPALLLPRDGDDGRILDFDGLFCGAEHSHWPTELPKATLHRRLKSDDRGYGIRDLVMAYLQFASASSNNLSGDLQRRRIALSHRSWLLEVCCGRRWAETIRAYSSVDTVSPIKQFWSNAKRHGIPALPSDSKALPPGFFDMVSEESAGVLPAEWWLGPVPILTDTHGEELDALMQRVLGRSDFWTETSTWQTVIRDASWRLNGDFLADLIVPPNGSDELLQTNLTDLELGEVARLMTDWKDSYLHSIPTRIPWDGDLIGILLSLMIRPWDLRRRSWEAILPGLVEDRSMIRSVAFVAWRFEQQQRLAAFA